MCLKKEVDFSLLLPTRNRPDSLIRLIDSISKTSSGEKSIEILIYTDKDDGLTLDRKDDIVNAVDKQKPINIIFLNDDSGKSWYNNWWEFLWNNSSGKYGMLCGDDLIFQTYEWDMKINNFTFLLSCVSNQVFPIPYSFLDISIDPRRWFLLFTCLISILSSDI